MLLVVCTTGCAALQLPGAGTPDIEAESTERKAQVAQEFEQKRDQAQYQAAVARFQQNDTQGCRQMLEQLLTRSPAHFEGQLMQAELLLLDGDLQPAKEQIEALLTERPEDAGAHHLAGLLLEAEDNLPMAVAQYEQAVRFAPDNSAFKTTLQVAQEALTDRKTGGARGITRVASDEAPTESAPLTARQPARSTAQLTAAASPAGARFADAAEAVTAAADLIQNNQAAQARHLLESAKVEFSSSAALYRTLGLACYRSADYQAAYDALQTALSLDNANALSYFLMGCTLSKLGERQAAEELLSRAAALDPRFARATASAL
jgi:tetratricopeptide (TPR) repeat protein